MSAPARLLRLLTLLQTRRDWTGEELARRLEVTTRTVRNDVERLRSLGYPIEGTRGGAGGYRLGKGGAMPPLLLDDDEAVAVAVSLRTANASVAGTEDAALRALTKLEQVLPARLRARVSALRAATVQAPRDWTPPPADPDVLTALASAARDRDRMRFEYAAHDGARTRRFVEPHRLVSFNARWYLVAWDVDRDDWRTFRVDRIDRPWAAGGRFGAREMPASDLGEYVAGRVSEAGWRATARITIRAPIAEVARKIGPAIGRLQPVDDATCSLETGADSLETIGLYAGLLDADFTVEGPPELVAYLSELGRRYARAASGSSARVEPEAESHPRGQPG